MTKNTFKFDGVDQWGISGGELEGLWTDSISSGVDTESIEIDDIKPAF